MTVFWLSIWDGFFKVNVYVPEKYRADLLILTISEDVKHIINDAKQMGDRLKFFPVVSEMRSDDMIDALFEIVKFKKQIK